jgi:hypothetical protein
MLSQMICPPVFFSLISALPKIVIAIVIGTWLRGFSLILPLATCHVLKTKNRPVGRFSFGLLSLGLPDPAGPNSDCILMLNNKDEANEAGKQEIG